MTTEPTTTTTSRTTTNPNHPHATAVKKPRRWPIWLAVIIILLAVGGYLLSRRPSKSSNATTAANGGASAKRGGRGGGPVPVSVQQVTKGNMGEYVEALGTVTPVYTVTVVSRVAGQLMDVKFKEGQMVKKGELLAVVDPRPYAAAETQAQGQLDRDNAALNEARIDLKRYQDALSAHAIPEQQLATQQATVKQDEGTVVLDQGSLDAAKVNVEYTQIKSPIDGRVGLRLMDPGNIVQANGTSGIVLITQLQPITVIFTMAEGYIADVSKQLRAGRTLQVDAMDASDSSLLDKGKVLTVDNQIDVTTGTVKVRAIFPNPNDKLFPNEFVNAKLLVKTLMGVNLVPTAAIQRNGDASFVYLVDQQNKVHSQNVQVATTNGLTSAVTGVVPGDTVVIDGFDKLQDGSAVRVRPPTVTPVQNQPNTPGAAATEQPAGPGQSAAPQAARPRRSPPTTTGPETAGTQTKGAHKKAQKDSQ